MRQWLYVEQMERHDFKWSLFFIAVATENMILEHVNGPLIALFLIWDRLLSKFNTNSNLQNDQKTLLKEIKSWGLMSP